MVAEEDLDLGTGPLIFCTSSGIRGLDDRHAACERAWRWPTPAGARAGTRRSPPGIAEVAAFLPGRPASSRVLTAQPRHVPSGAR